MQEQGQNVDIFHKAEVLMKSALKKYSEGDIEHAEKDRQEANRLYDKIAAQEPASEDDILYTENRNFGMIYHVLESNMQCIAIR